MTSSVTTDLLATLDARYKELKAELEEIKALKVAIKGASGETVNKPRKRSRNPADGPTFQEMIRSVLLEKGCGADALEIIELIKIKYGKEIMRTSLSPQLSRMKGNGHIILDDKTWLLPEHNVRKATERTMPGMPVSKDSQYSQQQHAPLTGWRDRLRQPIQDGES